MKKNGKAGHADAPSGSKVNGTKAKGAKSPLKSGLTSNVETSTAKKRARVIADSDDSDDEPPSKKEIRERHTSEEEEDDNDDDDDDGDVNSEEDNAEADEEDEAIEENKEKEKDGKAIKKLAAIFEKKAPTETKASWKQGDPVPYSAVAETFAAIEATTKRIAILEILTSFFVKVIRLQPDDLLACVYLCINRICPDYEGLELGIGESLLIKSIAQSTGRDVARLKKDLEQKGDLGLVAIVSRPHSMRAA